MSSDSDSLVKTILPLIAALGVGGVGMDVYNNEEHRLELEAEQLRIDRQTEAHERALRAQQEGYRMSLERMAELCR